MATPDPGREPDDFDWTAAEAELRNADVVNLDDARKRRTGDDGTTDTTHFDVALDEEPTRGGMLVDPPPTGRSGRQPIISDRWVGWQNIKASLRDIALDLLHRGGYHAVRSPWYGLQAGFWSTIGVFRVLRAHVRWWWVSEQNGLRQQAADRGDDQAWYKLHREVKATRAWRGTVLASRLH